MKLVFTLLLSLTTLLSYGQKPILDKPKVDERVELLSIVFRLAGSEEYSATRFKKYTDHIEAYYAPYKNHELMVFIKNLRKENGVGYDAVMDMAIHLDDNLNPIVPFTDKIPDGRWGKEKANAFVRLLKKFYKDTNSKQFFTENKNLYAEASERFLPIYETLDIDWFTTFYGKAPKERFRIVNALANGGGNYGPSIELTNKKKEVYAIMGAWKTDSMGMVDFPVAAYFPTLVHEFNHSFVNYLLEKNPASFKNSGEIIFKTVESNMRSQAYAGWETMLNEALVRAAVIKYMKDHHFSADEINQEVIEQLDRGFVWIEALVDELENYDAHRATYPTLEAYMPSLANAYVKYANTIEQYIAQIDDRRPKVISIDGLQINDQEINKSVRQITIHFDRPLLGKGNSINYSADKTVVFPEIQKISYSPDNTSITIDWALKPNTNYGLVLTGRAYRAPNGLGMKDYEIKFKTKQ